jgi:phosphoglycerate dehydrogenase-like enzyme
VTVDYVEEVSAASYQPFLAAADALLIRTQPLPAEFIAGAPRLKIVLAPWRRLRFRRCRCAERPRHTTRRRG